MNNNWAQLHCAPSDGIQCLQMSPVNLVLLVDGLSVIFSLSASITSQFDRDLALHFSTCIILFFDECTRVLTFVVHYSHPN